MISFSLHTLASRMYTSVLAFITSLFFDLMFAKSRIFYENNMILRFISSDPAKSGLGSGAWINGYDDQNKDTQKHNHYEKISLLFFSAVYQNKTHVIPYPAISAILDAILNILQRLNITTTTTSQSNSLNVTAVENYQKNVINCDFDFKLNLTLIRRLS